MTKVLSIILVVLLGYAGDLFSLTEEEIFQQFQFNFATPGARANAMGRAFIGLADDATAAETNPAGLAILTRPEVSFEFKNTNFTSERFRSSSDTGQSISSPAFASFVYPYGPWRFAFFRQEFLNYDEAFTLQRFADPSIPSITISRTSVSGDFLGVNYGGSVAYQFSTELLLGASVKLSQLDVEIRRDEPFIETVDDGDSGLSLTLGALFNPAGALRVGAIYEKNAEFEFAGSQPNKDFTFAIKVPDRVGAGVAIEAQSWLTFVADVVHIRYSQLAEDITIVNFTVDPEDFIIDNATELHVGGEGVFEAGTNLFAVRAGMFTNPDHALEYIGPTNSDFRRAVDIFFNSFDRETEIGFTFGGGFVFGSRFQIDAAYVISDPFDEFSISTVYRF